MSQQGVPKSVPTILNPLGVETKRSLVEDPLPPGSGAAVYPVGWWGAGYGVVVLGTGGVGAGYWVWVPVLGTVALYTGTVPCIPVLWPCIPGFFDPFGP